MSLSSGSLPSVKNKTFGKEFLCRVLEKTLGKIFGTWQKTEFW
jgi:hypothetical protein